MNVNEVYLTHCNYIWEVMAYNEKFATVVRCIRAPKDGVYRAGDIAHCTHKGWTFEGSEKLSENDIKRIKLELL